MSSPNAPSSTTPVSTEEAEAIVGGADASKSRITWDDYSSSNRSTSTDSNLTDNDDD